MKAHKQTPSNSNDKAEVSASPEASIERVERLLEEVKTADNVPIKDELGEAAYQVRRSHWELGRHETLRRQWRRQTAIVVASVAAIVYLSFRLFFTLNLATPFATVFSATLLLAEAYGLFHLSLYFYQVWRLVELPPRDVKVDQTVDVFVTTYNEEVELLRGTLRACVEMEYPHTTYVLDDGEREEVRELAESLGVKYITRTDHKHAKAGNVNNALQQTDGQFVIILDADHVPHMHFIIRMLGYFNDPEVGYVQAPHTTYNLDNFLGHWSAGSRLYWEDVRMFFEAVQLGKNRHGVACFCGSAAMFRRKALDDIGLFATETITEDLHTGMRINAAGWKSLAVNEELVVGLAPEDPETFSGQRLRWGEGNLSVMAYDNPITMKGLNIHGRLNYLGSILNWTYGPARLIMYLVPLVMLFTAVPPVANLSLAYVTIVGFYLISVWTAVKVASNRCGNLLGIELAMMASFHLQVRAVFRAIFRRRFQRFIVTSKRRQKAPSALRLMWPQASVVILSIAAVSWAATRVGLGLSADYFGLIVGSLLAFYHIGLGLTILRQASRQRDPDAQWRHPIQLAVAYQYGAVQGRGVTFSLNEDGLTMLSRERLPQNTKIDVNIESPFTNAKCIGEVITTQSQCGGEGCMYVHDIAFRNPDPAARRAERDVVTKLIFGYIVPWSIAEYRGKHTWVGDKNRLQQVNRLAPFLLDIRSPDAAVPEQNSVMEHMDCQGVVATLAFPLNEKSTTEIIVYGPKQNTTARVQVTSVRAVRVGVNVVYRHRFNWTNPTPSGIKQAMDWSRRQDRYKNGFGAPESKHRLFHPQNIAWPATLACVMLLSAGLFWATHQNDLLMIAATKRLVTTKELDRLETIIPKKSRSRYISIDRLLRMYKASVAVGNSRQAAELALQLAQKDPTQRCRWKATSASHWAQNGNYPKANRLLRQIIASGCDRSLTEEERASLYIEAARVAIAVGDTDRSVSLFAKAGDLKSFTDEQINEYIGLLMVAGKLPQAYRLLKQMGTGDRVLEQIVEVYEIAKQPQLAVPIMETLLNRNPDDVALLRRLAELAHDRGDNETSINYYRQLQRLRPDDPQVRLKLAGVLSASGDNEQAIELLQGQEDDNSLMLLASILETSGLFQEALETIQKVTGKIAASPAYQKQLVRLLLANHRYEEAGLILAEYLKSHPEDQGAYRQFINAIAAIPGEAGTRSPELSQQSWSLLHQTLRMVYDRYQTDNFRQLDLNDMVQIAYALKRFDMPADAVEVLGIAVKDHPASKTARLRLAQNLADLGRYDEAEVHFAKLLQETK